MSKLAKGPKRVVRKRPLGSTFKPRPSREIDDRPYMKKRSRDEFEGRDERPRRFNDDDRPPRGRDRDSDRPRGRREFDGPPRNRDRGRPGPRREFDGPPRGKSGGFRERKWEDKPSRPPREDRAPADNRVLLDTVKRIDSALMEVLDRLARIEKELENLR